jgi:hypothetical protein
MFTPVTSLAQHDLTAQSWSVTETKPVILGAALCGANPPRPTLLALCIIGGG